MVVQAINHHTVLLRILLDLFLQPLHQVDCIVLFCRDAPHIVKYTVKGIEGIEEGPTIQQSVVSRGLEEAYGLLDVGDRSSDVLRQDVSDTTQYQFSVYLLSIEEIPCKFLLGGCACKVVLHKER